jgi:hypothetical protein
MDDVKLRVTGLKEVQGAFRQVDLDLPKELRLHLKDIADHVVGIAQQRMPHIEGEAQKSLKPRATQKGAGIAFPSGGPDSWAPGMGGSKGRGEKGAYYPWLDFGGTTGRGRVSAGGHQRASARGNANRPLVKGGRYLYPAIGESKGYIEEQVLAAVEVVAERAKFEVRKGT